jgi:outer membrane protein TolC
MVVLSPAAARTLLTHEFARRTFAPRRGTGVLALALWSLPSFAAAQAPGATAAPMAPPRLEPATTPGAVEAVTPGAPGSAAVSTSAATPAPETPVTPVVPSVGAPAPSPEVEGALPEQTLTLAEVVGIARQNPPAVLQAIAREQAALAQVDLARTPLLPSLSATVSGNVFASNGGFVSAGGATGGSATFSASGWVDGSLSARWTIWDFGRTALGVRAALESARGAREDVRAAERSAISQAAAAYFVLLADEEIAAQNRATVQQRERQLEISRGLVEAGARPPIEQTRAEVALDSARLDLTVADATARNDAASLAAAVALDPTRPVRAVRPREIPVDDDPTRAADTAAATRPEVAAARARLAQAEAQLSATRAAYYPVLSANASGSVRYTERFTGAGAPVGTPSELGSAAVALSVPIFDPTLRANVRAAEAQVAQARAVVTQQVLGVRTEAVQAALAVRSARQALAQAERLAAGAAANLAQAEGRYAAGVAPQLELVDAQAADATARVQVARARLQFEVAKVRLLTAIGRVTELEGRQ